jgi:hypothetical protein
LTAEKQPFVDNVYEGTVLPPWKHDDPYSFNLTGTKEFPERNISLKNVIKLQVLSGGAAVKKLKKDLTVKTFKVESKNHVYLVIKKDMNYSCTCIGYQYHKKCKHIKAVHEKVTNK